MATALQQSDVRVFRAAKPDSTWARVVGDLAESSLAHAPEWSTVIENAYGHQPLYLSAEDGDGRRGVLPAFIVRRPLVGTVVSSMPFLDSGGPCSSSDAIADALVAHLIAEARCVGADIVELRCTRRLGIAAEPMQDKVTLTLSLAADSARLWQQFDGSVRSRVRRAERAGLTVHFGGQENLAPFYDVFAARMRDLGSPVHGLGFLRAVLDSFEDRARIVLVRKGDAVVGGLVALAFKDTIAVPWVSCRKEYFASYPNMLLYWETMRTGCAEGFRRFDFGRSSRGSGTYRFKCQWGAREEPLFWYTIPLSGRPRQARPSAGRGAALLTGSWRHLPLALTRSLGPHIRKYLTQ